MDAGTIYIKTKIDNSGFESDAKDLKDDMEDVGEEAGEKSGNKFSTKFGSILSKLGGFAKGLGSALGVVFKLVTMIGGALGAAGIASGLVAGAFKRIADENKELIANVKYIIYLISNAFYNAASGLANLIAGAINNLINMAAKLLVYMDYILKAWFGISILSGASVEGFKKSQEASKGTAGNLGKAAKNAKELKKQLAGFDEMNVLSDNSDTGAGAGAGGGIGGGADFTAPTIDLEGLKGEIPEWIKWIAEHKDEVIAGLIGIAGAITLINLGVGVFMSLGIGMIIAGIVLLIQDIIKFIQDPTWSTFADILRDIAIILAGIAVVMIAINIANPVGWVLLLIAAVVALVALIIKNWDTVKEVLGKVGDWIKKNIIDPVVEFFVGLWNKIVAIFTPIFNFIQGIIDFIVSVVSFVWGIISSILGTIWDNIKITIDNIKQIISALWNVLMSILKPIFEWIWNNIIKPVWDGITDVIEKVKTAFSNLVKKIKEIFTPIFEFFRGIVEKVWGLIKSIATTVGSVIAGAFKGVINAVLGAIEGILNFPIKSINTLIGVINKIPGINLSKLNTFSLPRLAKGGIINQPGRGVAIGGESGAEGVIPLTDSQQMERLGEAIGRYITVNASITNTMNGRVISRELKTIQNENNFAFNR